MDRSQRAGRPALLHTWLCGERVLRAVRPVPRADLAALEHRGGRRDDGRPEDVSGPLHRLAGRQLRAVRAALVRRPCSSRSPTRSGPSPGPRRCAGSAPSAGLFNRFSGVVAFIGCAIVLHPVLTATGGSFALMVTAHLTSTRCRASGSNGGCRTAAARLFFAPALLLWLGVEREATAMRPRVGRADSAVWAGVAAAAVILLASTPLQGSIRWAFPFLTVLPVSWIALRVSLRASYSADLDRRPDRQRRRGGRASARSRPATSTTRCSSSAC